MTRIECTILDLYYKRNLLIFLLFVKCLRLCSYYTINPSSNISLPSASVFEKHPSSILEQVAMTPEAQKFFHSKDS